MKKILITGGAGNVGSYLAKTLAMSNNNEVVVVDNLSTGNIQNLNRISSNLKFIKADTNDFDSMLTIFLHHKFDCVFHYAAIVGVKRTLEHPINVLNDITNIKNVLELSKNTSVKKVLFSSSSEVYGEPFEMPQNEHTTPLNSRLPYAIVKNVGEAYLRSYQKEYGLDFNIFRFFNTYGPHQTTDFVIPRFVRLALLGHDIQVYGDGSQSRTFCHIQDNVDATIKIMEDDSYKNEVFNVGNDNEISVKELAMLIKKITSSSSRIVHLPPLEEGDMTRRRPDLTKMKTILNRDLISLEKGIVEMASVISAELGK